MSPSAQGSPAALIRSDYAPDRVVAGLDLAINLGLMAIWSLGVLRVADASNFGPWLSRSWFEIVYFIFALAINVWIDGGIYGARRWAFAGKAIFGAQRALQAALWDEWPACLLCAAVAGYALIRLFALVGPRSEPPAQAPRFLPDRMVGGGFFLLNVFTLGSWLFQTVPAGTFPATLRTAWYLVGSLQILWLNVGLFKSRGWAVGGGLFFAAICGLEGTHAAPENASLLLTNLMCLGYLGVRLCGWGPRVEGPLGLRSA